MTNTSSIVRRAAQIAVILLGLGSLPRLLTATPLSSVMEELFEIPVTFTASATTMTYEVSPGFQVTLQLVTIDIPARKRPTTSRREVL